MGCRHTPASFILWEVPVCADCIAAGLGWRLTSLLADGMVSSVTPESRIRVRGELVSGDTGFVFSDPDGRGRFELEHQGVTTPSDSLDELLALVQPSGISGGSLLDEYHARESTL